MNIYYTCESGFASWVLNSANEPHCFPEKMKTSGQNKMWGGGGQRRLNLQSQWRMRCVLKTSLKRTLLMRRVMQTPSPAPCAPSGVGVGKEASSMYFFSGSSHRTPSPPQSLLWHLCFATWRWIYPSPTVLLPLVSLFFPVFEALRPAISQAWVHSQS